MAINSKNNIQDVMEVLDNHPNMILNASHFSAIKVNWNSKSTNIEEISRELNIDINSMIFIDDNPVECEEVKTQCSTCTVLQLPSMPYDIPSVLDDIPYLENIRLTNEDQKKIAQYKTHKKS